MLQVIWKKMKKIRATHIISYLPTPYDGDILLINERYANDFEQWAKKSGASEQEAKALTQLTPLKEARLMKQAKAMIFKKHLSGNFDGEFPTINLKK